MHALAELKTSSCPGCNLDLTETAAVDQWDRPVNRYKQPPPHRCHACDVLVDARDSNTSKRPQALLWPSPVRVDT